MIINEIALEVEIIKDEVSQKKFMCPALLLDYVTKQFIGIGRGYKIIYRDVRPDNPYTKVLEL